MHAPRQKHAHFTEQEDGLRQKNQIDSEVLSQDSEWFCNEDFRLDQGLSHKQQLEF